MHFNLDNYKLETPSERPEHVSSETRPCHYCADDFELETLIYIRIEKERHWCCQECYPKIKLSIILTHY